MIAIMSENKQTTDSELLLQIVGYNSEAFEQLYNRYSATIYSLIKEIVTNQKLAEKILLNVFSVFLKRIDYYSTTSNDIFTWLTLLARNISLDALKRMKFVEDIPDYSDEYEVELILPNLSEVITPIHLDQWTELGEKIKSYKSHLTEIQNLVLSLVYFEGLNEEEIAKRLSVPVVTVRQKTLSIMESLHHQYTGKTEVVNGNKKVSPLIKLEALGCLSSEERKLLNELRKNDPDFLWEELGEYQNLTALLATTISIENPAHELNAEIKNIFIQISGGGEVDYKITSSERAVINKIQEPIKEIIQQNIQNPLPEAVAEQIQQKIQSPVPEPVQQKIQNPVLEVIQQKIQNPTPEFVPEPVQQKIQSPAPEVIQQETRNPIPESTPEPIQQKIESPIPVTNKQPEVQEKKKSGFELKFRERDPKELSLLRNLEKNDSSKKPVEVAAKTNSDIKLKNYNTAEKKPIVLVDKKEDFSKDKKPDPVLSKAENIKPPTPSIDINKKELEIKNDDPSIIIDKPKPAVVKEEVVVKNRLIPNSSINLRELLKNEERKIVSKESTIANVKEENKTEVKPVQPFVDKPVLESKTNEPIKEIQRPNTAVAKEEKKTEGMSNSPVVEKSEIKSNEPPKEFGRRNVFVDKYQKSIPGKPVETIISNSEPESKKYESVKEIQKINDEVAKTEKPVEIKSPQAVKRDDVNTAVKVPLNQEGKASSEIKKDEKSFEPIKPAVDKSNLKIRETIFAENEKKSDIINKETHTNITASKQVIEKVNASSKITESINIDEILSKIEDKKSEPPVLSEAESYEKEIISLRKKLRRNLLVSAAVFVILATSSIFVYLSFKEVPAKVVDKRTNTEKVNLAEQTNPVLNNEYKPEIETEKPVEKNENVLSEQQLTKQKTVIPPLPEITTKEESTLFAANINSDLISNKDKEVTQIAAAKTENIVPPKENKVVEEEPPFFVAVEEMPELIGGIKGLQSKIVYPEIAKRVGIEGKVIVQAIVDETGKVVSVSTIKGIGSGCDEVAMDAVLKSKFTPGKQRGKTVKTQVTIPIVFRK